MNSLRRQSLKIAAGQIAKAVDLIQETRRLIEAVRDEEKDVYDNLSEGRQQGETGQAMEAAISAMETALDEIDEIGTGAILEALDEAAELGQFVATVAALTKEEAEARAYERLPKWAKEHIGRQDQKIANLLGKIDASMPDPSGDIAEALVGDYISPLRGKVLPAKTIRYDRLGLEIHVDDQREALTVRGVRMGVLALIPSASNEVHIKRQDY